MKPSCSRPILIYFEFRSKPSLIIVICMDLTRPTNYLRQNIVFSYWEMSFCFLSFLYFSFFFSLFYVILLLSIFTKTMLLLSFCLITFFFHENYFNFFMFWDVPACSGMFRNVRCSRFYRRPTKSATA